MTARRWNLLLGAIFLLAIARLWLIQLPTSFWTDEMVTVFVVDHGADHPSLAIAPQVAQSIYYRLAWAAQALWGANEIAYRIPSVIALGLALLLIARLAARLIHPQAAWFVVFACLGLKSLNTEATDARPYALGILLSAAALFFLVRWLDSGSWLDAAGFFATSALVWRVHLVYWPFYFVPAIYAAARLIARDNERTRVRPIYVAGIFAGVGVALIPVARQAFAILREARAHVIAEPPAWGDLLDALKWKLIVETIALAIVVRWLARGSKTKKAISVSSITLILGWWLIYPLVLFGFSKISGDSLFIPRYLSLALPGAALGAAWFASRLIAPWCWKIAALVVGAGVLLTVGNWRHPWTAHANSDWRGAARAVRENSAADTPVICLSPFIEAKSPEWKPNYALPGFLYSYLPVYPIAGRAVLFPFGESEEAENFARALLQQAFPRAGKFLIYGRDRDTKMWRQWFRQQPELAGWSSRRLGEFGDVDVVEFEKPR